jgi:hypothetical protein
MVHYQTNIKAKDILDYCVFLILKKNLKETENFTNSNLYKKMLKEICFLIDTD